MPHFRISEHYYGKRYNQFSHHSKTHYSAKASLRAQYSAIASLRAQHSNWGYPPKFTLCTRSFALRSMLYHNHCFLKADKPAQ